MALGIRRKLLLVCLSLVGLALFACDRGPKKEAKIAVTGEEFVIRGLEDKHNNFVIDARGKVKNVGNADAKRVVVTANCLSCSEQVIIGKWFVSNIEKTDEQKDTISYIAAGKEEEFSFTDVALMVNTSAKKPDHLPEKFEMVIESFETVE